MSAYKPYPKYKPSGVEWLGDVPEEWEVTKLKFTAAITPSNIDKKSYEDELPITLCNYTDVYYNETITPDIEFMAATATRDQIRKFSLKQHDVIITKDSEDPNDIAVPSLVAETMDSVVCGYHLTLLRPAKNSDGRFLKRYFDSKTTRSYFSTRANGLTRYGLGSYPLSNADIALPPLPEQHQIATFLDRECGKLDALQAKQERLIELLKEKRQALISHAVTRGLDPTAKLKPSGIEWLGEVPEHWEIEKLWWHFGAEKGKDSQRLTKEFCIDNPGEFPVYSGQTANEGVMGLIDHFDYDEGDRGVLFATTVGAKAMELKHLTNKFSLSQNCMIIRPRHSRFDIRFYLHHFTPLFYFERQMIPDHMQPSFRVEDLLSYRIAIPPLAEQRAIVAHLDEKCGKIDQLKAKAERGIELLKERRSALISAAVTGKIDVRDA